MLLATALPAVTITEIHYDPPGSDLGLEFVEVHNDSPTVADISGWSFTEGIDFTFPKGSLVPARGHIVVCGDPTAFQAAYPGVAVAGAFTGRLDSTGETIVLANNGGGEVVRLRYRDREKWPAAAAGTGHTLALRRPHLDPAEPESWRWSTQGGGTPGRANFQSSADELEIIPAGATWNYRKGTAEFSTPQDAWRSPGFTPLGWSLGSTGIGYGDNDDATMLDDMMNAYPSVALRKTFSMTQAGIDLISALVLAVNYDDGFVAYLNGVEVARPGLTGSPVPFDALAASHEAGAEEQFEVSKSLLVVGQNVLAIQGHNTALDSSDLSLSPRLFGRKTLAGGGPVPVVFNELLARTAGARWVELYNTSSTDVDLAGYFLTDDPGTLRKHALAAGSLVPARGFLVVNEEGSGLDFSTAEVRLLLVQPDGESVAAAEVFERVPPDGLPASREGYSDARFPDGSGGFGHARVPSPGAANALEVNADIVINEIFYNPPEGSRTVEFLELFNRGAAAGDMTGWSFTKGIAYTFPALSIPAGSYVVVSQDPGALEAVHGIGGVLGPWTGSLSSSGEALRLVDALGNVVDEVRYADGGRWSPWADGGGSSLELIDPRQDNAVATAWEASDESGKSQWTQVTYTASYTAEVQSEIHLLLLQAGTVLIDDVSLKRSGNATEHIANGHFETNTIPWLIQGTHVHSRRIASDAHTGNACLELTASGSGDNGINKIDTDTSPAMTGGTYTLSFWTRWIRGCDKILSRADSSGGASLQRVTQLSLPAALGTPGAENSARAALKVAFPDGNLGPVIGDVIHSPAVPGPGASVTVQARARDADGIAQMSVQFRTGGLGDGTFTAVAMFDDGLHGDGGAGDGLFTATLPPQAQGTRVLFHVEGTDTLGRSRRFPVEAPARTLLYSVEAAGSSSLFTVRVNLDDDNLTELSASRPLHSDDLVDASFVFNDEDVYYNVGVRYHGSPWNRPPDPKMFRVRFNEDQPFIRQLKAVNLSRYGWGQNEGAAYYCIQSASRFGSPAPVGDYVYARTFTTGHPGFPTTMALIETVDSRYTKKWFPGDGDGYIYKIPGRRYLNDGGTMDAVDWTSFAYRGSMSNFEYERYRWYFPPGSRQEENRWDALVTLCSTMDIGRTPVATFDAQIETILDVEQFLRVEAARTLQDDWDTIGIGNGQNAFIYYAPNEGRFKLFPWDMDHTFGNVSAKLYPEGSESQVTRLVQRPKFRRMYLRVLEQMLDTSWDPATIGPYLTQTQGGMGADGSGILGFISSRRPSVQAQVQANVAFKLTNIGTYVVPAAWSGDYYSPRATERLRGSAPVKIESILVYRDGVDLTLPVSWTTGTAFSVDVPIGPDVNSFELYGIGDTGNVMGVIPFRITSTIGWRQPAVESVAPPSGRADGGTAVVITGSELRQGARVFFGAAESTSVTFLSATEVRGTAPAAAAGKVAVRVQNADGQSGELANAFEYFADPVFVRGDATGDASVDIADPVKVLFYLFAGAGLGCIDAADADNTGAVNLTDVVVLLNFLFRGGPAPAAPFPGPGTDPRVPLDGIGCLDGL